MSDLIADDTQTLVTRDPAEDAALGAAIAKAEADPRTVTQEDMKAWLGQIKAGNFSAWPRVSQD